MTTHKIRSWRVYWASAVDRSCSSLMSVGGIKPEDAEAPMGAPTFRITAGGRRQGIARRGTQAVRAQRHKMVHRNSDNLNKADLSGD